MPQIPTSGKERGPRSLKRMALAVALRNIASITDVGEMAFADAKPILIHIENPQQLHQLELNCPQLAAEPDQMGAVWSRLLTKKFPGWDTKGYLSDDDLQSLPWIDIYTMVKGATDAAMAEDEARLRQTLAGFSKAKEDNATQLVNNRALLRRMPGVMVKRRVPGGSSGLSSVLSFGSGSRTKMTSGQSVLRRARREAKEISKVAQLSSRLTENQAAARSQIRRAPASMMNDHRVANNPTLGIIRAPRRRVASSSSLLTHYETQGRTGVPGTGLGTGNAANEARLLALKSGVGSAAAPVSASAYVAKAARPVIQAPRKRASALESPQRPAARRAAGGEDDDDADIGFRNQPSPKALKHDHDDDDELFGVATKPKKRVRLTIENLEGSDDEDGEVDDLFGSDSEPTPVRRQPPPTRVAERSGPPTSSSGTSVQDSGKATRERKRELEKEWPMSDKREEKPSAGMPGKMLSKSRLSAPTSPKIVSLPQAAPAGSPPRRIVDGVVQRKKVDIFMRPKKK
ncbi:hypothetical protein SEPCBS119000_005308 [Sporothrix epigloea]|uniref:DNA replication regulator Sld3 C-terminal domain-containing protein n=1 Tax=Sporothrix epigloea TaxID=1892477 RepID=A0ABP0DWX2_9PEZI